MLFKYRKKSPVGGLAADLDAEFDESIDAVDRALVIYRGIRILPPVGNMYWEDFSWMAFGLSLHAPFLDSLYPQGAVFKVISFDFPLADYRPEVAALAVEGWLIRECGCAPSGAGVFFDSDRGDYEFDWGGAQPPMGR